MGHVFISYADADREFVDRLCKELKKANQKKWLDVDGIAPGGKWREEIDDAIRSAAAVVLILSPESSKSQFVLYEWSFALGAGVPLIPVLAKKTKLHLCLEVLQYIDFTKGHAWGRLIESLERPRQSTFGSANEHKSPTIVAEFELNKKGRPVKVEESYRIWISTTNVPDGTRRANYEIHDRSFPKKEREFSVDRDHEGRKDFSDWITSYGDILLTAQGKGNDGKWRTQSTLAEALWRGYGQRPPESVQAALRKIERN